jgi:signal peptidase I
VIVFIYPNDRKKDYIKRLIGLPNETVEIRNGSVYIDGRPLLDAQFGSIFYYNFGSFQEGYKVTVPPDNYFVLGDNSASSQDSRYWGFVPQENILGKALLIYWPLNRLRGVK